LFVSRITQKNSTDFHQKKEHGSMKKTLDFGGNPDLDHLGIFLTEFLPLWAMAILRMGG